jgi:signal transduction histidine kinase
MRREDIYDYPVDLRCKDGSVKHVLIHSNGLWEGGQFVHTRCFIRDITEQKRMEQALRDRNHELREAVATRDVFLSIAAHELKTPVTSLRGFVQLLLRNARRKREIAPERLESALDAIELQTGKLNQLVVRLLDTAQIEAGKLRIEPVRTDLVALVHVALAQQLGAATHTFVVVGPEQLEAAVDPVRFEQVITNLLDNAVKFSPQGSIVTVGLEHGDDGGIRLSVTDQGVGIPPDRREDVFDCFCQAHSAGHLSGMGLGLHITREIVELHGGCVWIEEPEHRGSRFVVALPPSAACRQGSAA